MFGLTDFSSSSACSPSATTSSCSQSCSSNATVCSCSCSRSSRSKSSVITTTFNVLSKASSFLYSFACLVAKPLFMIVMKTSFVLLRFSLRLIWETAKIATECILEIAKVVAAEIKNARRA